MNDADGIRALYDAAHASPDTPLALPTSWLDQAVHPGPSPLRSGARVLVAGCGTGNELLAMAAVHGGEVVGVDVSPAGLAVAADRLAKADHGERVRLVQGDLTDPALADALGRFDLILASAVLDYVPDAGAALATLADCLGEHGACVLTTNRPDHPRAAVHRALDSLGLDRSDPAQVRAALAVVDAARPEAPPLATLPDGVVAMDLTVPFAHHWPLDRWAELARSVGLHLAGSLGGPTLVPALPDAQLPAAMALGLDGLALLHDRTTLDGGRTTVFTRRPPLLPPFVEPAALGGWIPTADPAFAGIGPLAGDPHALRPIQLPIPGHGTWAATVPAWIVEVLRRADGVQPLAGLLDGLPDDPPALAVGLFRVWAIGLLRLAPSGRS